MKSPHLVSGALGSPGQFNSLRDDAAGGAALLAHQQLGAFSLGTNPSNAQTLTFTVNGTGIVLTGKTGTISAAGDFKIGATIAITLATVMNQLQNPWQTNATQIALSLANQQLLAYIGFALSSTTLTIYSLNTTANGQLTSFSGSTTFSSGSYTAQTMKLFVEPGTYYINGTQVKFAGGSSPLVTAPAANPRIDLLTIDSSGTLAWTTGSESASPVPPTYPTYTKVPICELYNVVGETSLYDNANQQAGQGYIQADVRSFPTVLTDFTNISQDFIPDVDNTRNLGSASKQFGTIYSHNIISGSNPVAFSRFGGTGADGALSISSGTTTVNLGGAAVFVKNYTSISITGTGTLAFSNPHANGTIIILKSQGNVTLTSSSTPMINASGMGAGGGSVGSDGSNANAFTIDFGNHQGLHGTATASGAGGSGGATLTNGLGLYCQPELKTVFVTPGAGGSGGNNGLSAGNGTGGTAVAGGNGGGALYIECAGSWNFTTANGISVAGVTPSAGGNGSQGVSPGGGSGASGAGGGAAGMCLVLYNILTANSGTVNVSGGNGGNAGTSSSNNTGGSAVASNGAGGGAGGYSGAGGAGGTGVNSTNNGNAGSAGSGTGAGSGGSATNFSGASFPASGASGGGGGAGGLALIELNNYFA